MTFGLLFATPALLGWLLWPAGAAALAGVAALAPRIGLEGQAAVVVVISVVATVTGRRFLGRGRRGRGELNDAGVRMIGLSGVAATGFEEGRGRVFVDGKEWAAELDGGGSVAQGGRVRVIALVGGARLKVRPA